MASTNPLPPSPSPTPPNVLPPQRPAPQTSPPLMSCPPYFPPLTPCSLNPLTPLTPSPPPNFLPPTAPERSCSGSSQATCTAPMGGPCPSPPTPPRPLAMTRRLYHPSAARGGLHGKLHGRPSRCCTPPNRLGALFLSLCIVGILCI